MKKVKKILALLLCAILLVGASVAGTVAYLTDTDAVTNTFAVGKVEIYLDETDIDNSKTAPAGGTLLNEGRDVENKYADDNKLVPGRSVTKDPTVWVKEDSEPAYIRMLVKVGGYDSLAAAFANTAYIQDGMVVLSELVTDWDYNTWEFARFDDTTDTYEFRYRPTDGIYTAAAADGDYNELPALFKAVKIPASMTNESLAKLADVSISVTAQAIQSEGFENANEAWGAFPAN